MADTALLTRSALELSDRLRSGEFSAQELTELALTAIEAREPEIGAFTHVAVDAARAAAAAIDAGRRTSDAGVGPVAAPFAGVPLAIKDNRAVAGMPLTCGSALYGDFRPRADTHLVARLRRAGFVLLGKTSMPEFGIMSVTDPARFGPTRNPWDHALTPGGSSGGAAAAVAAGMVPLAHGNDGGGSIRIPAACCGLVGLKPSRNRVSVGPEAGQSFLVADGVLTRTVADTAALLDVLAGYETGDAAWAPPLPDGETWRAAAEREPEDGLRVGLVTQGALPQAGLDPYCRAAVELTAARLEGLGHHVEPTELPWAPEHLLELFTDAFGPLIAMAVRAGGAIAGHGPGPEDVEALTWAIYDRARGLGTLDFLAAQSRLERLARRVVAAADRFDVILTPALAERPPRIGAIHGRGGPDHEPWQDYARSGVYTPYTAIVNVTGQPAIALPVELADDGLPTAIQLIGPPGREDLLLSLAGQLERAHPWEETMRAAADPGTARRLRPPRAA